MPGYLTIDVNSKEVSTFTGMVHQPLCVSTAGLRAKLHSRCDPMSPVGPHPAPITTVDARRAVTGRIATVAEITSRTPATTLLASVERCFQCVFPGTSLDGGELRGGVATSLGGVLVANIARRGQAPPWRKITLVTLSSCHSWQAAWCRSNVAKELAFYFFVGMQLTQKS